MYIEEYFSNGLNKRNYYLFFALEILFIINNIILFREDLYFINYITICIFYSFWRYFLLSKHKDKSFSNIKEIHLVYFSFSFLILIILCAILFFDFNKYIINDNNILTLKNRYLIIVLVILNLLINFLIWLIINNKKNVFNFKFNTYNVSIHVIFLWLYIIAYAISIYYNFTILTIIYFIIIFTIFSFKKYFKFSFSKIFYFNQILLIVIIFIYFFDFKNIYITKKNLFILYFKLIILVVLEKIEFNKIEERYKKNILNFKKMNINKKETTDYNLKLYNKIKNVLIIDKIKGINPVLKQIRDIVSNSQIKNKNNKNNQRKIKKILSFIVYCVDVCVINIYKMQGFINIFLIFYLLMLQNVYTNYILFIEIIFEINKNFSYNFIRRFSIFCYIYWNFIDLIIELIPLNISEIFLHQITNMNYIRILSIKLVIIMTIFTKNIVKLDKKNKINILQSIKDILINYSKYIVLILLFYSLTIKINKEWLNLLITINVFILLQINTYPVSKLIYKKIIFIIIIIILIIFIYNQINLNIFNISVYMVLFIFLNYNFCYLINDFTVKSTKKLTNIKRLFLHMKPYLYIIQSDIFNTIWYLKDIKNRIVYILLIIIVYSTYGRNIKKLKMKIFMIFFNIFLSYIIFFINYYSILKMENIKYKLLIITIYTFSFMKRLEGLNILKLYSNYKKKLDQVKDNDLFLDNYFNQKKIYFYIYLKKFIDKFDEKLFFNYFVNFDYFLDWIFWFVMALYYNFGNFNIIKFIIFFISLLNEYIYFKKNSKLKNSFNNTLSYSLYKLKIIYGKNSSLDLKKEDDLKENNKISEKVKYRIKIEIKAKLDLLKEKIIKKKIINIIIAASIIIMSVNMYSNHINIRLKNIYSIMGLSFSINDYYSYVYFLNILFYINIVNLKINEFMKYYYDIFEENYKYENFEYSKKKTSSINLSHNPLLQNTSNFIQKIEKKPHSVLDTKIINNHFFKDFSKLIIKSQFMSKNDDFDDLHLKYKDKKYWNYKFYKNLKLKMFILDIIENYISWLTTFLVIYCILIDNAIINIIFIIYWIYVILKNYNNNNIIRLNKLLHILIIKTMFAFILFIIDFGGFMDKSLNINYLSFINFLINNEENKKIYDKYIYGNNPFGYIYFNVFAIGLIFYRINLYKYFFTVKLIIIHKFIENFENFNYLQKSKIFINYKSFYGYLQNIFLNIQLIIWGEITLIYNFLIFLMIIININSIDIYDIMLIIVLVFNNSLYQNNRCSILKFKNNKSSNKILMFQMLIFIIVKKVLEISIRLKNNNINKIEFYYFLNTFVLSINILMNDLYNSNYYKNKINEYNLLLKKYKEKFDFIWKFNKNISKAKKKIFIIMEYELFRNVFYYEFKNEDYCLDTHKSELLNYENSIKIHHLKLKIKYIQDKNKNKNKDKDNDNDVVNIKETNLNLNIFSNDLELLLYCNKQIFIKKQEFEQHYFNKLILNDYNNYVNFYNNKEVDYDNENIINIDNKIYKMENSKIILFNLNYKNKYTKKFFKWFNKLNRIIINEFNVICNVIIILFLVIKLNLCKLFIIYFVIKNGITELFYHYDNNYQKKLMKIISCYIFWKYFFDNIKFEFIHKEKNNKQRYLRALLGILFGESNDILFICIIYLIVIINILFSNYIQLNLNKNNKNIDYFLKLILKNKNIKNSIVEDKLSKFKTKDKFLEKDLKNLYLEEIDKIIIHIIKFLDNNNKLNKSKENSKKDKKMKFKSKIFDSNYIKSGRNYQKYINILYIILIIYSFIFMNKCLVSYNSIILSFINNIVDGDIIIIILLFCFIVIYDNKLLYYCNLFWHRRMLCMKHKNMKESNLLKIFKKNVHKVILILMFMKREKTNKSKKDLKIIKKYKKMYKVKDPLESRYYFVIILKYFFAAFIFIYIAFFGFKKTSNWDYTKLNLPELNIYISILSIIIILIIMFSYIQFKNGENIIGKLKLNIYVSKKKESIMVKIVSLLPLLYEIIIIVKWLFNNTSLGFFDYLNLNQIENTFNKNSNEIYVKNKHKKINNFKKYTLGFLLILILLIMIVGPLIVFSTFTFSSKFNTVKNINFNMYINLHDWGKIKIFMFSNLQKIETFDTESLKNKFNKYYEEEEKLKSYVLKQIQKITITQVSDTNIQISKELMKDFLNNFKKHISEKKKITFDTEINIEQNNKSKYSITVDFKMDNFYAIKFINMFKDCQTKDEFKASDYEIKIEKLFNKIFLIKGEGKIEKIKNEERLFHQKIFFTPICYDKMIMSFEVYTRHITRIKDKLNNYIYIINDVKIDTAKKYLKKTSLLSLYITIVIIFGFKIKSFFKVNLNAFQFKYFYRSENILILLLGIKISQMLQNYKDEKELYKLLLDKIKNNQKYIEITENRK